MAKFSMKKGGKEVGSASVYAKPHTMTGNPVSVDQRYEPGARVMERMNISAGGISKGNYAPEKTDGITMRGHGAATKGIKSRGPMA